MNAANLYVKAASGLFALTMSLGLCQAIATGMGRSADDARAMAATQHPTRIAQNHSTVYQLEPIEVTARRVRVIEM